ncbi:MAG: histidine phosphatase family protein [Myxococcaceae bacterium]
MILTLLLMRHAKSAFALNQFSDHERSLAPSGREAVPKVATQIVELNLQPDAIYCSDALRTRETLNLFVPALSQTPQIEISNTLYQTSPAGIIHFIEDRNPDCLTLQIIGHNPTLESLTQQLSGEYRSFKPADIAVLTHSKTSWDRALNQQGSWTLTNFLSAI